MRASDHRRTGISRTGIVSAALVVVAAILPASGQADVIQPHSATHVVTPVLPASSTPAPSAPSAPQASAGAIVQPSSESASTESASAGSYQGELGWRDGSSRPSHGTPEYNPIPRGYWDREKLRGLEEKASDPGYFAAKYENELERLYAEMLNERSIVDLLVQLTTGRPWYQDSVDRYYAEMSLAGREYSEVTDCRVYPTLAEVNGWIEDSNGHGGFSSC